MNVTHKQLPPDGKSGDWAIETFTVSKQESDFSRIRAMCHPLEYVEAGTYKRLARGHTVVMSNTQMELRTNSGIMRHAKGHVLLNGLGLGVVLVSLLNNKEVTEITVIEKSADVMALTAPHFVNNRLHIIHADAFDYKPPVGVRYGAVWHDIWDYICGDNLPQMTKLKRKYGSRADWQGCWGEYESRTGR